MSASGSGKKVVARRKNYPGNRFKHHLAGTRENVEACLNVSDEVRAKILEVIINTKENAEKKKRLRIDVGDDEANTGNAQSELGVINAFNKPKGSGAGSRIGKFTKMLELVGKFEQGLKPPSYHEIREKYLNMEVNKIEEMLKEYKEE
ncbi:Glutathione S-transferase 1 [Senna tora]|uniref:Glutathione S-transferase 1 n=1 Tax=Senna tora TaxID=362788 RepID=A0A834WUP3_9FABA|nr:Glutathione S-transferase 1 [Senna tora]